MLSDAKALRSAGNALMPFAPDIGDCAGSSVSAKIMRFNYLRALNMLNPGMKGYLHDVVNFDTSADPNADEYCDNWCMNMCHEVAQSQVDATSTFTQVVHASADFVTSKGELRIQAWLNNPAGSDSRVQYISFNRWSDTTALPSSKCDSLYLSLIHISEPTRPY